MVMYAPKIIRNCSEYKVVSKINNRDDQIEIYADILTG
jgi:hypothetical protein